MNQASVESLVWLFDPIPPSGEISGNNANEHILGSVTGDPSRTFVEETINNSLGAADSSNSDPTDVKFTFRKLYGADRSKFLEALNWGDQGGLRDHLDAASLSAPRATAAGRALVEGLGYLSDQGRPLTILKIEDFNTTGLPGPESPDPTNATKFPFPLLFRADYLTNENDTDRPGSHGVGKAVLWRYSCISTVLGSSVYDENDSANLFRAIGKSQFPFHSVQNKHYSGKGYFGIIDPEIADPELKRVISVKDGEHAAVDELLLKRDPDEGTGTSLLIVGFREPSAELDIDLEEICDKFVKAIQDTFWPALINEKLRVQVTAIDGDEEIFSCDFDEMSSIDSNTALFPYLEMLTSSQDNFKDSLEHPGEISKREISIKVPARTTVDDPPPHERTDAKGILFIRMAIPNDVETHQNQVALIRGKDGFVVDYWSHSTINMRFADNQFHAAFIAGRFIDDSVPSRRLADFLRASEPPTHDAWQPTTQRLREQYSQGYGTAIRKIYEDIRTVIIETIENQVTHEGEGPSELKRYFQMGGGGGGAPRKFTFSKPKTSYDGSIYAFSRKIRKKEDSGRNWILYVSTVIDIDGRDKPEIIEIDPEEFNIITSDEEKVITPDFLDDGTLKATIPADETIITYEGKTKKPENPDQLHLLRNSRMVLDDNAKEESESDA